MEYIIAIFMTGYFNAATAYQLVPQNLKDCEKSQNLKEVNFSTKNFSIDNISYTKIPTKWKKE